MYVISFKIMEMWFDCQLDKYPQESEAIPKGKYMLYNYKSIKTNTEDTYVYTFLF